MTNLAGHDMETVLEAFHAVGDDQPQCFVCYTVKGNGLPFAGHKDNHSGLMNPQQMAEFQREMGIAEGAEWDPFAGLDTDPEALREFLHGVPFAANQSRRHSAPVVAVPELKVETRGKASTQQAFGHVLNDLGRGDSELAKAIVTTSPDVTVSTNLGAWVNHRGLFERKAHVDIFREENVASAQRWARSPSGQHFELGIAENNLFLMLGAMGLSESLFGARLLPIGALYDPFINRGLDSLFYSCYQDARFMLVATPAGITLAPEGGAHQSINTPLIGMTRPGLAYFEPAFADEVPTIMGWGFRHMQADDGGSIYLRLSTRSIEQPDRAMTDALRADITAGGYWLKPPAPGRRGHRGDLAYPAPAGTARPARGTGHGDRRPSDRPVLAGLGR